MSQKKFLVQESITVGEFLTIIRKNIKLNASESIFLFVDNTIPSTGSPLSVVYEDYKSKHPKDDGFLYLTYAGEATFGNL
eukprot:MONOS_13133.1-p1 / transcript=MONOS_13133.1 / gene=MONOS_13133 / organism=Monocercomonoides_exilis_PA203 / gene_product=Autophagy-related protein 8 C (Atg8C) / transcript_product=Autophagy-related protein 8 C (Atg8C) / location=Mono_scaffold00781:27119-27475(-) / protein_length=80 / sequence_SO=supercontig / SO=protein_coding / is_pseudo=false